VYFALHHLIVDAVSWRILTADLKTIYAALSSGKVNSATPVEQILGNKGSSYRQWVTTIQEYALRHSDEIEYWNNLLADYNNKKLLELVVDENTRNFKTNIKVCLL
jgi:hypothetical protein